MANKSLHAAPKGTYKFGVYLNQPILSYPWGR